MTAQEFINYLQKNFTLKERKEKELVVNIGETSEAIKSVCDEGPCMLLVEIKSDYLDNPELVDCPYCGNLKW